MPRNEETYASGAPDLSVVIPAYNEEGRLPHTLERVHGFLQGWRRNAEILVVDDGSRDGTRDVVARRQPQFPMVRLLGYSRNRGKGYAVRTGVMAARGKCVLFSDADLSTPIEELERMWAWYEQGHDLVIASRSMADSRILVRQSWYRRGIGRAFNQLVGVLAVRGFKDTQCGFKLFAASAAKKIFAGLRTRGFAFDVEVLMRARRYGFRIAEVPVRWVNDAASKVHPVRDSVRMLVEILRLRGLL